MDHDITADARYVRGKYPHIQIRIDDAIDAEGGRYRVTWTPGGEVQIIPANSALVVWSILRQQIEHDERAGAGK